MEWRDEGVLIATHRSGETAAVADCLTAAHGRWAGLVHGGAGRRMAPVLQPGAQLDLRWRARTDEALGTYTVEPQRSRAAALMASRLALTGLHAVCALIRAALPDREPHPRIYAATVELLDLMTTTEAWPLAYAGWEVTLLADLGYALGLEVCAVTGAREGLRYVSPRTGRAVTAQGAGAHADRLLPLPPVLLGQGGTNREVAEAMDVTGHFLRRNLAPVLRDGALPDARARLRDRLAAA
ncbi:MAG: DNA repair protein RecO [Paracoccaceae bacterium]